MEKFKNILIDKFGESVIVGENTDNSQPFLMIETGRIAEVCLELHDHPECYFDYLSCLTGLDNGPEAGSMEIIYHLYSIPFDQKIVIKTIVERSYERAPLPKVPSVSGIWKSADWHEREAYDLLGIEFENHPDLRRILCPANWEGHPLRKDYRPQDFYHGIKVPYDNHNEENGFKREGTNQFMTGAPTRSEHSI